MCDTRIVVRQFLLTSPLRQQFQDKLDRQTGPFDHRLTRENRGINGNPILPVHFCFLTDTIVEHLQRALNYTVFPHPHPTGTAEILDPARPYPAARRLWVSYYPSSLAALTNTM